MVYNPVEDRAAAVIMVRAPALLDVFVLNGDII
jgi:hypothetical protein